MKAVSLSLKIIALLAAAFCVYAWVDTRGKISTAETHMKGVPGETLVEKAPKVPGLLKTIAENKEKIAALQSSLRSSEQRNQDVNSELESERVKGVQANAEIVKKNAEIRSLNANVASSKKRIAEKDSLIESLKKEIVSTKALLSQTNEADALKDKIAALESQLGVKSKARPENPLAASPLAKYSLTSRSARVISPFELSMQLIISSPVSALFIASGSIAASSLISFIFIPDITAPAHTAHALFPSFDTVTITRSGLNSFLSASPILRAASASAVPALASPAIITAAVASASIFLLNICSTFLF